MESAIQEAPAPIASLAASENLRQRSMPSANSSICASRRAMSSRETSSVMLPPRAGSIRFCDLEIGLDRAGELDGQRIAVAVKRLAGGDADPTFADAIFLDIGFLGALEADADIARQSVGVEIGAARIVAQAVGRGVG